MSKYAARCFWFLTLTNAMTDCHILCFRGLSLVSRLIQLQTRSPYSHVAILTPDNTVIEAWHRPLWRGAVTESLSVSSLHSPGTPVDVFEVQEYFNQTILMDFLREQKGMPYDWSGVGRFLTRRPAIENQRWFCSELIAASMERAGLPLSNLAPHYLSPRDIAASPLLKKVSTIYA